MDWGTELWDQCDIIEKHTQSGLELVEKYVKFVKERTEIEQSYAKQLRNLSKKYNQKRSNKDEPDCRLSSYQSFVDILNEMNDYAGQRELIAENMIMNICIDLTKYLQELKQERKTVSLMRSIKNALILSHLRHAVDIKRLTRPDTVQFL